MADNATLNYATFYQAALHKRYDEEGNFYSRHLWNSPSNNKLQWKGRNTVRVPRLFIKNGRTDRARRTVGQIHANYENQWIDYTLENERHWHTLVDPSDIDETNFVTSIANITRVFNDTEKIPEMDKQMFSSLFQKKQALDGTNGITTIALTEANILFQFDRMMHEMDEQEVPREGRVLYLTPTVAKVLKNAEGLTRNVNVQQNNGVISRAIQMLENVEIREVISSRFRTLYDFTVGAREAAGSRQIQMMLIHVPCMAAPQKYDFVGLDTPNAASFGNYKYYEQAYDDVILFETLSPGVQFIIQ